MLLVLRIVLFGLFAGLMLGVGFGLVGLLWNRAFLAEVCALNERRATRPRRVHPETRHA